MAVTPDGTAVVTGTYTNALNKTLSGKTTAGANRVGIVHIGGILNAAPSVTWDGVSMQPIDTELNSTVGASLFYIVNPPTAASDIIISFNGNSFGAAAASSYQDCDIGDPIRAFNSANDNGAGDPTVNVSSAVGDLVVDAMGEYNDIDVTVGAGQTQVLNDDDGATAAGCGSYESGAASVTMSWTLTGGAKIWGIVAASIKAATASTPTLSWMPRTQIVRKNNVYVVSSGMTPPDKPE